MKDITAVDFTQYYIRAEESAQRQYDVHLKEYFNKYAPAGQNLTVMDFACGWGRITNVIKNNYSKIILCDISEKAILHCKERFGDDPKFEYVVNTIDNIPVESDSVDFVFSWDSMVQFNYRLLDLSIFEINRVLKKGGYALLHHSNYRGAFAAQKLSCSENYEENKMSRACTSYVDVKRIANHYEMDVVEQKLQDWGSGDNFVRHIDCFSVLQKKKDMGNDLEEILFKSGYVTKY